MRKRIRRRRRRRRRRKTRKSSSSISSGTTFSSTYTWRRVDSKNTSKESIADSDDLLCSVWISRTPGVP